jgi:hypothetical protein
MPETTEVENIVCDSCGTEIPQDSSHEVESDVVCDSCKNLKCKRCACCEDWFYYENMESTVDGKVCESCLSDNYFKCEGCSEWHHTDYCNYSPDDVSYCEDCFRDNYCSCEQCGETFHNDDLWFINDSAYCESCRDRYLRSCSSCGEWDEPDNFVYYEEDDVDLCSGCARERQRSAFIHDYSYCPEFIIKRLPHEKKASLTMGFELEVECEDSRVEMAKKLHEHLKTLGVEERLYFKHDGSLNNGFEIVSQPATYDWNKKNLKLHKVLEFLSTNGFTSYKKGSCGFHVHVGIGGLTADDIDKLRLFMNYCFPQILKFSRRKGKGEHFCCRESFDLNAYMRKLYQEGRYWALNTSTHKGTIEFRIFRGTLSYARIQASLQFVEAVCYWVMGISPLYFYKKTGDNIWKDFKDWCQLQGKCNKLINYLTRNGI